GDLSLRVRRLAVRALEPEELPRDRPAAARSPTHLSPPTVRPAAGMLGRLECAAAGREGTRPVRSTILACYFFAFVTPLVSVSVFWRFVFQPSEAGLLNAFLGLFGVEPQWWLLESATALPSLALVGIWRHVGYVMVLFLAGLQSVPESFHLREETVS